MKRIYSIDFTRGLVMIIMALDHVRDLMHVNSVTQSPTDLTTTTPILFFTRWITYLCAPIFVFLAGTSAYISFRNKGNVSQSRNFLLKRGLWLVILEFTIVNFGIQFDPQFHIIFFEVIAAIGFGFIVLGLLIRLPAKTIGIIGLVIIFSHDLFSLISFGQNSGLKNIFTPFFGLSILPINSQRMFIMAYPPLPWLGIMLAGFGTGRLFELPEFIRKKAFLKIGLGAFFLFLFLRFVNVYGDPAPWAHQKNSIYTFLSFVNVTKYPPSLLFCLVTLGIMFLILAFSELVKSRVMGVVSVYGKVPLFYFLLHFYIIHLALIGLLLIQGFQWAELDFASGNFGRPKGVASGVALWLVYLIWTAVVCLLYKPCLWYGRYKATHKDGWLKYI